MLTKALLCKSAIILPCINNNDIESYFHELHGIDVSDSTNSRITDKVLPIVKEWQEGPLEDVYAVVYLDAIHFHVRSEILSSCCGDLILQEIRAYVYFFIKKWCDRCRPHQIL